MDAKPSISNSSLTELFLPSFKCLDPQKLNKTRLDLLKNEIFTDIHLIPLGALYSRLEVDPDVGLTSVRAADLLTYYGHNELTPPLEAGWFQTLLNSLCTRLTFLLWLAALLCFGSYSVEVTLSISDSKEKLYLGCLLVVVIVISGLFNYAQTYKCSKIFKTFSSMMPKHARCLRNGVMNTSCPTRDLVKGDIVHIHRGDVVPADLRIIKSKGFKVNNASLTGESLAETKDNCEGTASFLDSPNIAFLSTHCVDGWAAGVVICCGDLTALGRVAIMATRLPKKPSPLTREIQNTMIVLSIIAIAMGLFTLILTKGLEYPWIVCTSFFIGAIIANVPEGFQLALSGCLQLTAQQMAKQNCLVKNLYAIEALGKCSTICSNKTGTLTRNKLCVRDAWMWNSIYNITDPHVLIDLNRSKTFTKLRTCGALCSQATLEKDTVKGDPAEVAILEYLLETFDPMTRRRNFSKVADIQFNSDSGFQASVHLNKLKNTFVVMMKGAPEVVVPRCAHFASDAGQYSITRSIKSDTREDIAKATEALSNNGEKVFAFADLVLNTESFPPDFIFDLENVNFPLTDLRFLGLMGLLDPPRKEAVSAIKRVRDAGVRVLMVTGDHPLTARTIAEEVGIATSSQCLVVTGNELRQSSPLYLGRILDKYYEIVFARISPTQKLLIVETLQLRGEVVAMTGDGANDAPAMRCADIAIAMGLTGSKISNQCADIILMDDSFATIVKGIEEGRKILANLKKCVCFLLISNTPAMFAVIMSLVCSIPLPLGYLTILCLDLGTDLLAAIAMTNEKPERNMMMDPPRKTGGQLFTRQMLYLAYLQLGLIEIAAGMFAYFFVMAEYGFFPYTLFGIREKWDNKTVTYVQDSQGYNWTYEERKTLERASQSAYFVAVVLMQVTSGMLGRTRYNSVFQSGMPNKLLNVSMLLSLLLAAFLCYMPGVNEFFGTYPLELKWWFLAFPFCLYMVIFDELRKFCIRRQLMRGWFNRLTYY